MKKRGIDKGVVVLLVLTLITAASWVGFEVYQAYVKVIIPAGIEKHLKELDPVLKMDILDSIERLNT